MSKYWSSITKSVEPYVCGEQPKDKKYIKLNTNESPYGPSPKVLNAIKSTADENLSYIPLLWPGKRSNFCGKWFR